jgi:hypothetical protein
MVNASRFHGSTIDRRRCESFLNIGYLADSPKIENFVFSKGIEDSLSNLVCPEDTAFFCEKFDLI